MSDAQIGTKRVHTGKVLNLDIDRVRFPDGSEGELEIIRHPGASAVVPFLSDPRGEDPQILLLRQYRYAANGYLYEIPAGRLDEGEAPEILLVKDKPLLITVLLWLVTVVTILSLSGQVPAGDVPLSH